MRSVGAYVHFLLVALVVVLAAIASDRAHFFCKMMERTMVERCCAAEPVSPGPAASNPDCCERLVVSHHSTVAEVRDATPTFQVASVLVTPSWIHYPTPSFRVTESVPAAARAPPAIGPPPFIAHCSLLI